MMAKRSSARKTTFLEPKSDMKARGTLRRNESFGKTHRNEKTERGYFLQSIRKLVSSI